MNHLLTAIASIVLAAAPVHVRQATPPALPSATPTPPSATATIEELAQIRAQMFAVREVLSQTDIPSEDLPKAKAELARLIEKMRRFSAQQTLATARVPVDPKLIELSGSVSPRSAGNPPGSTTRGGSFSFIYHFAQMVESDLAARGSDTTVGVDATLSMFTIIGPQWQVEEAKAALKDALPAYLQRVQDLEAIDASGRADQRERRERELFNQIQRSTVNIDWEGGTLGALVETVRSSMVCNVVLAEPSVSALEIPALSVKLVAPDVFFRSLQAIPLNNDRRLTVSVIAPEAKVGDGKPATAAETLPVIVIAEKFQANRTNQPALTEQRIFDLSDRPEFDAAGIKKLIEAIDFAMQANDTAEQMKIRFHEPSRLLFAKGPHDSISLFDEVVNTFLDKK